MIKLAKDALAVQSASSLSGVAQSFAEVMRSLREHCPNLSTAEINRHPIAVVWADKIAQLAGCQATLGHEATLEAFRWVNNVARETP